MSRKWIIYSLLSLSRLLLSRISAYLEVKIWSLFKHGNLIIGIKILWKRGEIAPQEQFLLFPTIFSTYLQLQESNYIFICIQFYKSDLSRYGYLEIFKSVSWTEITRVGYTRIESIWRIRNTYLLTICLDTLSSGSENPVFILIWT